MSNPGPPKLPNGRNWLLLALFAGIICVWLLALAGALGTDTGKLWE